MSSEAGEDAVKPNLWTFESLELRRLLAADILTDAYDETLHAETFDSATLSVKASTLVLTKGQLASTAKFTTSVKISGNAAAHVFHSNQYMPYEEDIDILASAQVKQSFSPPAAANPDNPSTNQKPASIAEQYRGKQLTSEERRRLAPRDQAGEITELIGADPRKEEIEQTRHLEVRQASQELGVPRDTIIRVRRQYADGVTGDDGNPGRLEQAGFAERNSLPATGAPAGKGTQLWDHARGVMIHAPWGMHFEFYEGGAARLATGPVPEGSAGAPVSSLFVQPTRQVAGAPPGTIETVPGFKTEHLAFDAIQGKTIEGVVKSVHNPVTGVDVNAAEGEFIIVYTDGTVEIRKAGALPGRAVPINKIGPTLEQLGITTSKKQQIIDYAELEYIGHSYVNKDGILRIARPGHAFYQDPKSKVILERPDLGPEASLPSTSPSILASRQTTSSAKQSPSVAPQVTAGNAVSPKKVGVAASASTATSSDAQNRQELRDRLNDLGRLRREMRKLFNGLLDEIAREIYAVETVRIIGNLSADLVGWRALAKEVGKIVLEADKPIKRLIPVLQNELMETFTQITEPFFWFDQMEKVIHGSSYPEALNIIRQNISQSYVATIKYIDRQIADVERALAR